MDVSVSLLNAVNKGTDEDTFALLKGTLRVPGDAINATDGGVAATADESFKQFEKTVDQTITTAGDMRITDRQNIRPKMGAAA